MADACTYTDFSTLFHIIVSVVLIAKVDSDDTSHDASTSRLVLLRPTPHFQGFSHSHKHCLGFVNRWNHQAVSYWIRRFCACKLRSRILLFVTSGLREKDKTRIREIGVQGIEKILLFVYFRKKSFDSLKFWPFVLILIREYFQYSY